MAISKTLKFSKSYTIEELYDLIKDHPFEAGRPALVRHVALMIVFPEIDSHNQVQIIKGNLLGKRSSKYMVQKSEAVGLKNLVKNELFDLITNDWANKRTIIGTSAEESSRLVDATAAELESMNL